MVSKPSALIVDVDDTLSNTDHRAHHLDKEPPDWDAFFAAMGDDPPKVFVVEVVRAMRNSLYSIVALTGRPERYRMKTVDWLARNGVPIQRLYMRANGDLRPDAVVKKEMLDQVRRDYNPVLAIDDKPSVIEMLTAAGVPCLAIP